MTRSAIVSVLLLALASVAGGSWYGRRDIVGAAALKLRTPRYYVDPMHPAYTSDTPGTAPDCGMALEPVYASGPEPAGRNAADRDEPVRINPQMQQRIGVRVERVEQAIGAQTLRLYGRVMPDETRVYRVNAGIEGYVRDVSPVTTGGVVHDSEPLATIAAPEARTPIQSFLVALEAGESSLRRPADVPGPLDSGLEQAADRLLTLGMSHRQVDEIRRTRRVPATIEIAAPAGGFVLARNLSAGEKVAAGQELFRIADLRHVWIVADVRGRDAAYIRGGMQATIAAPDRGTTVEARVSSAVPPQFDAATQSTRVRLEADNFNAVLRPDMFVDVRLPIALPRAVTIPIDALVDSGLHTRVFVERADGQFEPRDVETGWRLNDRVEIVAGLSSGDRVVVSGAFLLDSETRMRGDRPRP